jgi:hypothetical protein
MWIAPAWAESGADPAREVLALERQAMDGWLKGDPDPQLAISDPQITYFHAVVEKRLEGLPALKELYERYRGIPLFDSYEILNPMVQTAGDVAILTYQLAQRNGSATTYWNATEVYQRKDQGWRIIHTHWSAAKAQ